MKTGIIFPSYAHEATGPNGGWSAEYPFSNTRDLVRISNVARSNAVGSRYIQVNIPAGRPVRAIALIGHNLPAGSTIRFATTAAVDSGGAILQDSGFIQTWPGAGPVDGYRSIRPYIFSATASPRTILVQMEAPAVHIEVQGLEIGDFWEWPGISYGRDLGFRNAPDRVQLAGGASYDAETLPARVVSGSIDMLKVAESTTLGLDSQKKLDLKQPFVWAEDYDDASTWARKCLLVRNVELPKIAGSMYQRDRFPIRLIEHKR